MVYDVGIDVGTMFTCAATAAPDGRSEVVQLGQHSQSVPSVVSIREDGTTLIGSAAQRRLITDPARTIREFKRRFGDETPYVIGGTPYGAEVLTGKLIEGIIGQVVQRRGEVPRRVALTHPASWGPFKLDLLRDAARIAGISDVLLVAEPVAATLAYALRESVPDGGHLLVYDLGGGTFDAAVVEMRPEGPHVVGKPEGIERLGGVDFDHAVVAHVDTALGGQLSALDRAEPVAAAALARVVDECRAAKEALSADTEAEIPVVLPGLHRSVRLTRGEFEAMVAPRLGDTIAVVERVVASAGLRMDEIHTVLLVGGSSRIPLVAQTVRERTGRPVAIDTNPKSVAALGAALYAAEATGFSADPPGQRQVPSPPASEAGDDGEGGRSAPPLVSTQTNRQPKQTEKAKSPPSPSRDRRRKAIPVAVLGIAALGVAVVFGSGGDSASERVVAADAPRLACASELGSVCDDLANAGNVRVTTEAVATTASSIPSAETHGDATRYDGWLAPVPSAAAISSGASASEPDTTIARSPLVIAVWKDRERVLAEYCGGTITWKCVGEVAGAPWTNLGGDASWGDVKVGQPDPVTSTIGADTLGAQAASFFGRSDLSRVDFESDDFLNWFTVFQRSLRSASGASPFERMLAAGSGAFDVVGTIEVDAAPRLQRLGNTSVSLVYASPVASVDARYTPLGPATGERAHALGELVTGDAGRAALARAGWRVAGVPHSPGVPSKPTLPRSSNLPDAGALAALVELWMEVTQ